MDAMREYRPEREAGQRLRRANVLNWLLCALHEAESEVVDLRISSDGICEWVDVDIGRGIVRRNVTGLTDVELMITVLNYLRSH